MSVYRALARTSCKVVFGLKLLRRGDSLDFHWIFSLPTALRSLTLPPARINPRDFESQKA